jgi:signal peptidase I
MELDNTPQHAATPIEPAAEALANFTEAPVPSSSVDDNAAAPAGAKYAPRKPIVIRRTYFSEFAESLLITILIALFGTTFILQAFKIPSESMQPTLLIGDYLLVNKFIFEGRGAWYEKILPYRPIHRGDIIVFKFPFDDHQHYVKRVVGLPGDHVRIIDQRVYVNGAPLDEPYVVHDPAFEDPFGDNFPPTNGDFFRLGVRPEWANDILNHVVGTELVVPPNHYFALGDNRDHSLDSRYWGFVDRDAIMGRPMVVYWSVRSTSADYTDRALSGTLSRMFDTLRHLNTRTRWHRLLHTVH